MKQYKGENEAGVEYESPMLKSPLRMESRHNAMVAARNSRIPIMGGNVRFLTGFVMLATVTADQIADHELYHWKMDAIGRIGGDRFRVTRECVKRIKEEYDEETFDEVLDAYLDGYGEVYDVDDMEYFLNRVYEEIMADAYAGINAFGTEASKFRGTVNRVFDENGLGRDLWNAAEQEDVPAPGGDRRAYTDEDAPPEREFEDYSQVPEEDWDDWDDSMIDFSYAGENAQGANMDALERAKEMEAQGFTKRQIFQETGWFRGADGKWRFEIDDSAMKYRPAGDAQFRTDHPEYVRYKELELKLLEGDLSEAEFAELRELSGTWGREHRRLAERVRNGSATLWNMISHDALFKQYPQLRDVKVRFGETDDVAAAWWDRKRNEIVVNDTHRNADDDFMVNILIHEIQHTIQDIEGFAVGSNPEYWEYIQKTEKAIRVNDRRIARSTQEALDALARVPYELHKDFWYAANMWETDPEGASKLREELEAGEYAEAYGEYSWAIDEVREWSADNPKRSPNNLYLNTAGEIEARDVAWRQPMTAEERKNCLPNTGGEDTVFAEGNALSALLIGKTRDGIEVYETSEDVMKLSWKERKQRFLRLMRDQYRGRTAKFDKNGHTYYARFEYRDVSKNIFGDSDSDDKGRDAKIKVGADGGIFELVENSRYTGSEPERGKTTKSHRGVTDWDYFVKTVQVDGVVCDLTANVRQKPDGEFVYAIEMHENKEIEPSPPEGSQNSGLNGVLNSSTVSLQDNIGNVKNQYFADDSSESSALFSVEDEELTREAYDRLMAEVAGDQSSSI